MNIKVRRLLTNTPMTRRLYVAARKVYHDRRMAKSARRCFVNVDDYIAALSPRGEGTVDLRTKDGLLVTVRLGSMDAEILAEIFFDNCYTRELVLAAQPVVVDIGGYIGDFAIYAVKRLHAQMVVVAEPSPHNWELLKKNVTCNHYGDKISMVNKAVTDGRDVLLNVDAPGRGQAQISAFGASTETRRSVHGVTLEKLIHDHQLKAIDLLKIDCEGGEYSILLTAPDEVYRIIRNIVFECHEIEGFEASLRAAKEKLRAAGFSLRTRGSLVWATRDGFGVGACTPS